MTPERQKWWDSLPTNERELRVALDTNRRMLSFAKGLLTDFKGIIRFEEAVRKQKLIIKALKHELDRSKVAKVKKSAAIGSFIYLHPSIFLPHRGSLRKAMFILPLSFWAVSGLFARFGGAVFRMSMLYLTQAGFTAQRKKPKLHSLRWLPK